MKIICGCGRDTEFIEIDTSHSAYVCKECKGGVFVYSMSDFEARELFEEMLGVRLDSNETTRH